MEPTRSMTRQVEVTWQYIQALHIAEIVTHIKIKVQHDVVLTSNKELLNTVN
jgi:hypothetical protein